MVHDPLISDHYAIFMHLLLHKPQFPTKTIRHRKLRKSLKAAGRGVNDVAKAAFFTAFASRLPFVL